MSRFKMKRGQESKVNSLAKEDGSLIFSLNGANNSTVRLDQTVNGTVQRLGIAVDKAKDADGVIDYNEPTRRIKIGYSGAGLNTSNLNYIAGYTNNGTQIKDVSKDVLKNWLGTMGSADSAKVIEPFENATANASRNVWFSDSEVRNKPVYNDNFKYNPITQILTTNISGSAEFANLIKYYQQDSQFYASGDTHIMELGYLKCDGSYQNLTLYITSAFWGNQHGSADLINIQQDTNTNSSATVQSYVHAIRVGGSYDRTFYAYKDQTNKRLYLYVQVIGGNSYGKWNVSVIQCSSGYNAWVSEFGFNKILPTGYEIISKIFLGTANNSNALGGSSLSQVLSAAGSDKFLPLTGGTLTGPLSLQSTLKGITTQALSGNTIKTGNNAVTITLPTSNNDTSNAMYMYANQNGPDIGIIYISPDTAFIANSGDTGYVFRVIDKDVNTNTNSNDGMLLGVRQSREGLDVRSSIFPTNNLTYSLGSSDLNWNNAYASTFHGYLNGIASNAQKLEGHPASYFAVASGTSSNVVENGMYLISNTSQVNNRFSVKNGQLTSGNTNFPSNLLLAAASTDYPQLTGDSAGTTKNYSILHFGDSAYRHDIVMACSGTNTGIIYAFATTANTGGRLARIMDSLNYSGYMYRFDNQITFSKGLIANSPSSTVLIDGGSYTGGTQSGGSGGGTGGSGGGTGGSGGGTGTQSLSIRVEGTKLIITTK